MIIVDSNVIVATAVEGHPHRPASTALLSGANRSNTLIAAHSLAEVYNTLTRQGDGWYHFTSAEAADFIEVVANDATVVALSAAETRSALRTFATTGRTGPRVYDYLIGKTGETFGAHTIATWNVRHYLDLFANIRVITPDELAK